VLKKSDQLEGFETIKTGQGLRSSQKDDVILLGEWSVKVCERGGRGSGNTERPSNDNGGKSLGEGNKRAGEGSAQAEHEERGATALEVNGGIHRAGWVFG